jgi:hypothetical protein
MTRVRLTVVAVAGLIITAAAAFSFVGGSGAGQEALPKALLRDRVARDALPARVVGALDEVGFETRSSRAVARGIYLVERDMSGEEHLCLVSTNGGALGSGCNPKASFFHGQTLLWSIDEKGKPSAPTWLSISGVVTPKVRAVRANFGGISLKSEVTPDGGFVIEATDEALAAGRPTTLEALNQAGGVVTTIALPTE